MEFKDISFIDIDGSLSIFKDLKLEHTFSEFEEKILDTMIKKFKKAKELKFREINDCIDKTIKLEE